jgi:hypothetical protein
MSQSSVDSIGLRSADASDRAVGAGQLVTMAGSGGALRKLTSTWELAPRLGRGRACARDNRPTMVNQTLDSLLGSLEAHAPLYSVDQALTGGIATLFMKANYAEVAG